MNLGHRATIAAIVVALMLAAWHLHLSMRAVFLFRNDESVWSWASILIGPVMSVFAALLALIRPKWAGYCLVAGGCGSFVAFAIRENGVAEHLFPFLLKITIPMLVVGAALLLATSRRQSTPQQIGE